MIDFAILGKKLMKKYPFMANELISKPLTDDLDFMYKLHQEYMEVKGIDPKLKLTIHNRLIFIAVIVKMYDPDYFEGFKKNMRNGIRLQLHLVLNCEASLISHSYKTMKNYIEIYPAFTNEVTYIYEHLKKFIKNGEGTNREENK